jgi:hypothetical protein
MVATTAPLYDTSLEQRELVRMKPCPRIFFRVFPLLVLEISACKEATVQPPAGDWTVRVSVTTYDEFNLIVPPTGPTDVLLTASDWTLHAVIPPSRTKRKSTSPRKGKQLHYDVELYFFSSAL